MKISLNWLKEFIDIPKNITPQKLAHLLTEHSVEVEEVIEQAKDFDNIVVGQIIKIDKHPNADKLKLVQVNIGQAENIQVVCGGTNLEEKMFVALAKVGSRVKWHGQGDLITLEKTKIRGEESVGMICSACEIGLGKYVEGDSTIMKFEVDQKKNIAGIPLAQFLKLDDVILDIENKTITHRPDLWGHFGIARELGAIFGFRISNYEFRIKDKISKKITSNLKVEVKNKIFCQRYMGVVVDGVKIEASPEWLQNRLVAVGVRPINNIVDITNYVMLETGQPMHAYDANKLASEKIIVRLASQGEKVVTLDKVERKLDTEMLVIADEKKVIAIAGIMGANNSEVDQNSTKIILESANFDAINSRITATKLGLRTEASARFEKHLDPNLTETALAKALSLISEIVPSAKISSKIVDENNYKPKTIVIKLSVEFIQKKIGVELEKKEIQKILESLGFKVSSEKSLLKVTVPSWRATSDISSADDLVEEVARIYGFNKIQAIMPTVSMDLPEVNLKRKLEKEIKNILTAQGLNEVINYSFISEDQVMKMGKNIEDHIKLLNSLSQDHTILRQSLTENLLKNIQNNLRYFEEFSLFEIGSIFKKGEGKFIIHPEGNKKLPIQETIISGVIASKIKTEEVLFFNIKEVVENLLSKFQLENFQIMPSANDSSFSAKIEVNQQQIGTIFILNKKILENFEINKKTNCAWFEINLDKLNSLPKKEKKFKQLNKFPSVEIDIAIIASKNILWHNIDKEIKKIAGEKLKQIELFDIYEGENIAPDKISLAIHLNFAEEDRTMEMKEVEKIRDEIISHLNKKFGAIIRS
jgi:phenylalanyl-tRNA synthetase beta chain